MDPEKRGACFDGNRGVVMVPYHSEAVEMAARAYKGDARHSHGDKKYLLSFAGSMAFDMEQISHFYYGVRQKVFKLFHEHPRFKVEEHSVDMQADIRDSTFCLTPSGWGAQRVGWGGAATRRRGPERAGGSRFLALSARFVGAALAYRIA